MTMPGISISGSSSRGSRIYNVEKRHGGGGYLPPPDAWDVPALGFLLEPARGMVTSGTNIGEGTSGGIFPLSALNGLYPNPPLVIKDLYKRDDPRHNLETASTLIRMRKEIHKKLLYNGLHGMANDPYLMGLPLFAWIGQRLDDQFGAEYASGYAMANLRAKDYEDMNEFTDTTGKKSRYPCTINGDSVGATRVDGDAIRLASRCYVSLEYSLFTR